ncbi:DUF3732 domain-containing protein [Clostridium beijerinckii]|uniref:DUF3732 domain-containing protein n=1 Tax=Clostridium beijerinckii TaxID=1520 RepID=UPI0014949C73|nr:DUF3732 domain-containing protein [Clostridium beijerinckii]NOW07779.1 hypothetical protein [Clostridium beijerinckii]NYC04447.1 hypothetical protein [Clostridium beijerinckii]
MKRWNINRIILYSKKNDRKIVEFNLTGITIITGKSRTGKSVITEIIDYSLGASKCHFPPIIKEACSWVGLVLKKNDTETLILRKVPSLSAKSSGEFFVQTKKKVDIPENRYEIKRNTDLDGLILKLESMFKIREIDNSFYNNEYKSNKRISVRNLMPYLLQDDDNIISKTNIVRGLDSEKRQSIIDSAPYFLGAVSENFVQKKFELSKLKREFTILSKKLEDRIASRDSFNKKAALLLKEAQQVGLVENTYVEDVKDIMKKIIKDGISDNEENSILISLYEEIKNIENDLAKISNEIKITESHLDDADVFKDISIKQKSRFVKLQIAETIMRNSSCPICGQKTESVNDVLRNINRKSNEINNQIEGVEQEKPKLDNYLLKLKEEYESLKEEKRKINETIKALVNEKNNHDILLEERKNRVKGKIEYFLDNIWLENSDNQDESKLIELEKSIQIIEEEISFESIKENIESIRIRINNYAYEIIKELPLEEKYKGCPVDFNISNMIAGIVTKHGKISMRDIGSDLNYLCLHVAILLAIHRHFDDIEKEYPGFLIFDQLSRPFFPPDPKNNNETDEIVIAAENEKQELKQFFDYLFKEICKNRSLQIIIYEHAYFEKDENYVSCTKYRWNDEGLIPESWKV